MNTSKYVTEKNNLIENTLEYLNSHELDDYAKQQIRELVSDYRPTINDREYAEEIFTNNSKEKAIEYLKQYNEHLPKELTRREKRSIEYDKKLLEEYQSNKNTNEFDDFLSIYEDEKVRNLWNIQSEDDLMTFYNGTSKTRAEHFLTRGTGGTRLENLAFINNATATSEIGLQVMFDNSRAAYYGKQQSALTKDTPVIIQGKIKAKYLHAGSNWGYEYGIPQEYWDKIEEASILHAETGETLQKLKNGKLEPYVPTQQQFKNLMDNHWINNVNVQSKDAISQGLERLGKETDATYSLPEVFLKHDNPTIKQHFAEVGLSKNDAQAYLFRQNDILFLNMHGTPDGKVAFRQNKLNPSQFLDILYDAGMLPEDISKIYTISCFGGLQKTGTTTKNGIPIASSHTSNKPIASIPLPGEISFALANGELSEDLMEDVIRNKDFKVEEVLTPQQINEIVDERLNKLVKKPKYKVSKGPKLKKEETTVIIEDDNKGIITETSSTKDTNIPDSSTNQNNAESIKQEEPIKPSKPETETSKPDFIPTDSEYNKYVWEEYQKGNTDVMSADEYYRSKHTPEEQAIIDEINNRSQQPDSKPEQNTESTPKTNTDTISEPKTKPDTTTPKSQPEVKPKSGYIPKRGPKVKSSNITKEQIEKVAKKTGMKVKKLTDDATKAIGEGINWNKVGKVSAIAGAVALVGFGIHNHNKKEKENRKNGPDRLTGTTRKSEFWNQSYTAQMAKDISTYQYGKRMTGFVQG
jgi:hypothetical protein